MNIDTSATNRPRPWLLIVLGLAIVGFVANYMWPKAESAGVTVSASNQTRTAKPRAKNTVNPGDLTVRLDALDAARPGPGESERNPFRFKPKAPPPPPPDAAHAPTTPTTPVAAPGAATASANPAQVHRDGGEGGP